MLEYAMLEQVSIKGPNEYLVTIKGTAGHIVDTQTN